MKTLEAVLPPRELPKLTGEEEEANLVAVDPAMLAAEDGHGHAMDEDDERGGPQRVQCQNM